MLVLAWFILTPAQAEIGAQHLRHFELFGADAVGYNGAILKGIDAVQSHAMDGGGYFIGLKADPPESPVGYYLSLAGRPLLNPPRTTSYCSGSSYSAFIEGLNLILTDPSQSFTPDRFEAMRMQEPTGDRREDGVKMWGWWNADGYGNHFAMVQYAKIGTQIKAEDARPGDFMNISWKSGLGHSTVFLGWQLNREGKPAVRVWSSQKGTNGFGDLVATIDSIQEVLVVRLTDPMKILNFDPATPVAPKAAVGEPLDAAKIFPKP